MVPFGLAQAPAYFQLLMNKVPKGLKFAMMYLDDIIIFSQDELQHLEHLEIVFSCLWEAGLKMKHSKCDFFKSEIHYLGHLISPEGISPLPNKLDSIKHIPVPNSVMNEDEKLCKEGRFSKKCIPQAYIPDFDWTTIHQSQNQPIKQIQQQGPTEDTTTPAAPTEVDRPPSSRLRSKTKQQHTSDKQEQPEHNPTPMDPLERNPAEIEVNSIDITPKSYSWMRLTKFLSYSGKTIDDPAPVSLP